MKDQLVAIDVNSTPADATAQDGDTLIAAKQKIDPLFDVLVGTDAEKRLDRVGQNQNEVAFAVEPCGDAIGHSQRIDRRRRSEVDDIQARLATGGERLMIVVMPRKLLIVIANTDPRNREELGSPFFQAAGAGC